MSSASCPVFVTSRGTATLARYVGVGFLQTAVVRRSGSLPFRSRPAFSRILPVYSPAVRGEDLACRYGGKNSASFPQCPSQETLIRVEEIRARLKELHVERATEIPGVV